MRRGTSTCIRARSGAVLLEVVVALTILVVAGAAVVAAASEATAAIGRARAADRDTRAASAFLEVVSLWTREDLDRHLGTRPQGAWRMRVEHPADALYTTTLTDGSTGRLILATSLFRPETRANR